VRNLAIARRYSKALLLIGKEDGQAETYREELAGVTNLFNSEKELERAICNPLYNVAEREKVLKVIIKKLSLSKVISSFLRLLFSKRRIVYLDSINDYYQQMADELKGVKRASLTAAVELSSDMVENIRGALSKLTGKDIILEVNQDSDLIGGIVTRIGDLVLDGSIKTQLLNMRESLKRGESV